MLSGEAHRLGVAGELDADGLGGAVDVEHLTVDADADDDVAVGRGHPELAAVHPTRIGASRRGRGEDLCGVLGAGEDVFDPFRREHAFAVVGRPAASDHLAEAGEVAQGSADGSVCD